MPEIHCRYENKRQRKRRKGIAQLSLSSLHSTKAFHVNHDNQENQLHCSSVKDDGKSQDQSSGVFDSSNGAPMEDGNILNNLTAGTATMPSHSTLKSPTSVKIRRRKSKRKVTTENERDCKDKIQQNQPKFADDDKECNRKKSSSFSDFLPQSSSIVIEANSNESPSLNLATTLADTDGRGVGRNSEVGISEIHEIFSVGYFRATPLDEFRLKCSDCLKQNLQSSSRMSLLQPIASTSTQNEIDAGETNKPFQFIRYDRLNIIRRLSNDIDWKSLCEHHDKREYKGRNHTASDSSNTALCEIVQAVMDPMVIPRCCQSRCLIDVFLNALLLSPSMSISLQKRRKVHQKYSSTTNAKNSMPRWTPSQQFLLESIRQLLLSERMPLDSFVSDYVRSFVISRPPFLSTVDRGSNGTSTTNTSAMSPNKVNRLLSAIYWLLSSSPLPPSMPLFLERELVSSGLLLLQRIDGWSIQIDTESRQSSTRCASCNENSSDTQNTNLHRHIKKKMTVEALSNLHDEAINIETKSTQKLYNSSNNKMLWRRRQKQVSLKDVLAMKRSSGVGPTIRRTFNSNRNSNINIRNEKRKEITATDTLVISGDWSTVCSRAYKKFLSYSAERRRQQHHLRELTSNDTTVSKIMIKQNSDEAFLWWLVNDAVLHRGFSSRRACIALVAHSFGGPKNPFYFMCVARLFWQGYLLSSRQQSGSSSQWLRLYSEWLSECEIFDQREIAWEAMQPILQHITARLISSELEQLKLKATSCESTTRQSPYPTANENHECSKLCDRRKDSRDPEASLMACLGYILHRRSYLFCIHRTDKANTPTREDQSVSKSSIEKDFRSFLDLLSIHCGEYSELWLDLFSGSTRDLVESTLQRLGVLSFSMPHSGGEVNSKAPATSTRSPYISSSDMAMNSIATSNWPFRDEFSLRKAMGRIDRAVLSIENGSDAVKSLLSHHSIDCLIYNEKTKAVMTSKKLMPSVPISNYLHDSGILCLIFSFCGPKRLTKIPLVCKTWKIVSDTVSNSLWENAYVSTFGKYRWPSLDAEHRHRISTCAIAAVAFQSTSNKMVNIGKDYWKNLFTQKHIAEKMVRFQRNSRSGYKHRTCSYVGCLHIIKTAEQERKHDKMHLRLLAKQQAVLKKKETSQKRKGESGSKSNLRIGKDGATGHSR